ncbi:hypothetical protein GMSM_45940 [Geomonas sp. Red276]
MPSALTLLFESQQTRGINRTSLVLFVSPYGSHHSHLIRDNTIKQDKEGRYCLNDLHRAAGGEERHRPKEWLANKQTQELVEEIQLGEIPPIKAAPGRYGGTFVVKELVYAYAMWISPKFHLQVIRPTPKFPPSRLPL